MTLESVKSRWYPMRRSCASEVSGRLAFRDDALVVHEGQPTVAANVRPFIALPQPIKFSAAMGSGDKLTTEMRTSTIPSGYPESKSFMLLGFGVMSAIYFGTIAAFDTIQNILQLPPSDPELCPTSEECWRSDLLSFEIVSGATLMWCGLVGFWAWHIRRVGRHIPETPEGRLFSYIPEAHHLTAVGTSFQIFDLFLSLLIPEQRQFLFICHHIMAATVSWYGLNNQYFHYYGIFYLGCSEISTIPLIFVDLAKFFPPLEGTPYHSFVNDICGPAFALTFIVYRVILWWIVGYRMFTDIFAVLKNGAANRMRPGRNHVLYVMIALNLLLGFLQLYWFSIILEEAVKLLGKSSAVEQEL